MSDMVICPACSGENGYFDGTMNACPECGHEWSADATVEQSADSTPRDSNGAELFDGDSVTVIKDLKVRGSSMVIKRGTKVKSIKLTDNPEEVDCRIEGAGIVLKTCFLKR
ncbi:MAG: zinc ribbon domain-containing protein YjdM [Rikenellaceae bacterium]